MQNHPATDANVDKLAFRAVSDFCNATHYEIIHRNFQKKINDDYFAPKEGCKVL